MKTKTLTEIDLKSEDIFAVVEDNKDNRVLIQNSGIWQEGFFVPGNGFPETYGFVTNQGLAEEFAYRNLEKVIILEDMRAYAGGQQ